MLAAHAPVVPARRHQESPYLKVLDDRKRPIRGLWMRNGRFYAQLTVEDQETGRKQVRRVPLAEATTPAQARQKLEDLLVNRRKGSLPVLKRTPLFAEFVDSYLKFYQEAKDSKRDSTMETEKYTLGHWKAHLGHLRLNQIRRVHIDSYIAARQKAGKSARTVNLDVTIFRNVMKRAVDLKWISHLPTENLRPLKSKPRKRELFSRESLDRLLAVCREPLFIKSRLAQPGEPGQPLNNGQEVADYLRLLFLTGARMAEAMRIRWSDVDWNNRQITIGWDGEAKNRHWRIVDFNTELEAHLRDMNSRRPPNSVWLFPSPRRGQEDLPVKSFRDSLLLARKAAGMPTFGFHDSRHFFISMCVMSGIDFMTIARWVGHQDGGILIGKVYGHLSNEHSQRQARRIDFGSKTLPESPIAQAKPKEASTNPA